MRTVGRMQLRLYSGDLFSRPFAKHTLFFLSRNLRRSKAGTSSLRRRARNAATATGWNGRPARSFRWPAGTLLAQRARLCVCPPERPDPCEACARTRKGSRRAADCNGRAAQAPGSARILRAGAMVSPAQTLKTTIRRLIPHKQPAASA